MNKNKIENKEDIANLMNTYFCEVGTNLSKNIKQPSNVCVQPIVRNTKTIFILPTNTVEISKIINDRKEKTGGVDGINAKTIKIIAPYIVKPVHHIFNLSIEHAIWPDRPKSAEVVPIHKAKAKSDISNYRPISLISNMAKILKK